MTAKLNLLKFILLITSCCLLLNTVHCLPTPASDSTEISKSEQSTPLKNLINDNREKFDKDDIARWKEREERLAEEGYKKYNRHDNNADDDDKNKDKDKDKDRDNKKPTPSNTVVTTIIIIATETPTSIYTGNGAPAKQKGTGDSDQQFGDPNPESSEGSSSKSNNDDEPSISAIIQKKALQDQLAYRKLVLALSIVGGIAGIALITGVLIFTRMRVRKRKRKHQDEEKQDSNSSNSPAPSQHRQSHPPPINRYSAYSDDGNATVIDFNENPFMDPSPKFDLNTALNCTSPVSPVHLGPRNYAEFRQNRTFSMLSQTASSPSAPTAKELDAMDENPFEDQPSHSRPFTVESSPPSITRRASLPLPTQATKNLQPPPAYTPSATPSAPPLYALPRTDNDTSPPSRRHSVDNHSIASLQNHSNDNHTFSSSS